jgi:hypothetical protein
MAYYVPRPTVSDLLDYLALTGANYPVEQAQQALDVAADEIDHLCVTEPYEAPLREAVLRRAQAVLTARGAPLGTLDGGAFGLSPMLRYDPEIGKLVANYLRGNFA